MEKEIDEETLNRVKKAASIQIREAIIRAMVDSGLTPNQCTYLTLIYLGHIEDIYKFYNSYSDKTRFVKEINELYEQGYIDVKLKKNDMGDLVDIMPKSELLCERILGVKFNKDLLELGNELKNAYPRKGFTLVKIDNMDLFCRKYSQRLIKSAEKFKMSEIDLHNKIIQIVKTNDINIRIVDFVESREWEAYMIEKPKTQIDKNDI